MAAYYSSKIVDDRAWPPVKHTNFINLALIDDQATWRRTPQRAAEDILTGKKSISYDELFQQITTLSKNFILLEGRPGGGKTFLVNKIVCDWADNKEISADIIVIFVPLQKLNFENNRSLATLIRVACPALLSTQLEYLVRHIEESNGENVIFVLDGLDEYKPCY